MHHKSISNCWWLSLANTAPGATGWIPTVPTMRNWMSWHKENTLKAFNRTIWFLNCVSLEVVFNSALSSDVDLLPAGSNLFLYWRFVFSFSVHVLNKWWYKHMLFLVSHKKPHGIAFLPHSFGLGCSVPLRLELFINIFYLWNVYFIVRPSSGAVKHPFGYAAIDCSITVYSFPYYVFELNLIVLIRLPWKCQRMTFVVNWNNRNKVKWA